MLPPVDAATMTTGPGTTVGAPLERVVGGSERAAWDHPGHAAWDPDRALMSQQLPRHNNAAELRAFEDLCWQLGGFAAHLNFEFVDGGLTALVCAGRWPLEPGWIDALFDDAFERAFGDPVARGQAERVLQRRLVVLRDQLDPEALDAAPFALRLDPLLADNELPMGRDWAAGFTHGLVHCADRFPPRSTPAQTEAFEALLAHTDALVWEEGSAELLSHQADHYGDKPPSRDVLLASALYAVQDLRLWVLDNAERPPPRRVEAQPGRNDPCPCGSGRKFKKCHGASGGESAQA
jgi:uncharacterized protein